MGRQSKGQALPYAAAKQPAPRSLSRGTIVLRTIPVVLIAGVIVAFTCAYCNPFTTTLAPLLPFSNKQVVPQCPVQPLAMAPDLEWRPEESREWIHKSAQALGGAVQIPTVTYDDMALDPSKDERFEIFDHFHDYLNQTFPLFHAKARLTKVNRYGLLYELPGSDQSLKPALYAGHQDVVPVPPDTEARWSHKPFGGFYDEESDLLWGRGSSDDKNMLIAIFEAFEQLQKEGFENKRTILFASGFDEEVGGKRGAAKLAETFAQRYGTDKPFEFILDEGGLGIGTAQDGKLDVALPAVGEKGYADVVISITTEGGHSSVPPDHTAIGLLSKMLVQLESKPFKPTLSAHNPILTHLICMADALDDHERRLPTANAEKAPASPGFRLDRSLRKLLRKPHKWDKAAWRISKEGTRAERYVIQTSQAIDVISGGAKANALPESASATVNHRISVDSNVKEVLDSIERIIAGVAAEYDLELDAFGRKPHMCLGQQRKETAGKVKLELVQSSEPTPISSAKSPQFGRLAATIRHVFPGRDGQERLVSPVIMTGNTDTRHYLAFSNNIWRFHPNTYMMNSGKHAIDERMSMFSHAQTARFIHALVQNTDVQL